MTAENHSNKTEKDAGHAHTEKHAAEAKAMVATPATAPQPSTETKKTKSSKKEAKTTAPEKTSNKPAKKKGKKDAWVKKEKIKKDAQTLENAELLSTKWKPVFWGRFGKKNLRTRNNPKYDKWRKPRGEDMLLRKDDGMLVQAGYRTPKAFRGLHPSGYEEVMIYSASDLKNVKPRQAARIAATIGRKKRITIIKIANEKKIPVLN